MSDFQNPQGQPQYQQQPQPQYQQPQYQQPYGGGFMKTPLPRYNVGSPWKELTSLDFKQTALICLGISLFSMVFIIVASGSLKPVFSVISTLSNAFLFALLLSKLIPFRKDNAQFGVIALAAVCIYALGGIVVQFKTASLENISDLSFFKFIGIIGVLSYGCMGVTLLLFGSKFKHFTLRTIVMLFGIGLFIVAFGCIFLLSVSSIEDFAAFGILALIGALFILIAEIMLLVKLVGSDPIEDPYALPGEPIQ